MVSDAIGTILNNSSGVTALTSTRIWPGQSPNKNETTPYIWYFEIEDIGNENRIAERSLWQINCNAKKYITALTLAIEIEKALNNLQGSYNNNDIQSTFISNRTARRETDDTWTYAVDVYIGTLNQ